MQDKKSLEYAGSLRDELDEVQKLIPNEESMEMAVTHTLKCGLLLTIYCC